MSSSSFNRLQNFSPEDLDRFVAWLFSHTLADLQASRGDLAATRAAWIRYFQRGLKADLLLDELMAHWPTHLYREFTASASTSPRIRHTLRQ